MTAELRFFGPGLGESIVVRLPGDRWVVVDGCRRAGANPVLEHLQREGCEQIDLLVLTHPHDDHYRGLEDLFEALPVARFWRYPGQSTVEVRALNEVARRDGDDELRGSARELARLWQIVRRQNRRRGDQRLEIEYTNSEPVLVTDAGDRVAAYGPPSQDLYDYDLALMGMFDGSDRLRLDARVPDANTVSAALVVEAHGTRVLLGGDVLAAADPQRGWIKLLASHATAFDACALVKVPHHASDGAVSEALWDRQPDGCLAIVTPFRRGGIDLPRADGLGRVAGRATRVWVTAAPSTRHGWTAIDDLVPNTTARLGVDETERGQVAVRIAEDGSVRVVAASRDARAS